MTTLTLLWTCRTVYPLQTNLSLDLVPAHGLTAGAGLQVGSQTLFILCSRPATARGERKWPPVFKQRGELKVDVKLARCCTAQKPPLLPHAHAHFPFPVCTIFLICNTLLAPLIKHISIRAGEVPSLLLLHNKLGHLLISKHTLSTYY